ncbi:MAG: hypothetical protein ACF8Q5_00250 [Phycisphaerales bacterium JB040]
MTIPAILVLVAIGWLALGLLIAVPFALTGIRTIDAVASPAPLRVRLLFVPGLAALWPLTLQWWVLKNSQADKPGDATDTRPAGPEPTEDQTDGA